MIFYPVIYTNKPNKIKATTVMTLMRASQNSDSANQRVEIIFKANTNIPKMSVHIHMELSGSHSCINSAAAVNSVPSVTDHVSQ